MPILIYAEYIYIKKNSTNFIEHESFNNSKWDVVGNFHAHNALNSLDFYTRVYTYIHAYLCFFFFLFGGGCLFLKVVSILWLYIQLKRKSTLSLSRL